METSFFKYQGTGNDFVIIDNRDFRIKRTDTDLVKYLCDRKFGVGADGLILLQDKEGYDFEMVYFNADGNESTMCGNGGRCITAFAARLGIFEKACKFLAIDGPHEATIQNGDWVELKMGDVANIEQGEDYYLLNTGSPHYVVFVEDIDDINVVENGQAIRYSKRFRKEGVNVNFVESTKAAIIVATYERGVEDETLSCGTGVTASAIAYKLRHSEVEEVNINTKGGNLKVRLKRSDDGKFHNIWLCGKGELVFEGKIGRK
ncbi:MAG: diaminopimelate epimerase [Saprospiraceae bacterium]|jgi:diaminopimelate epimerase